jgi:hypothetical protein
MLTHGDNESSPYKTASVERIKRAFHAMLRRIALGKAKGENEDQPEG